MSSSTDPKVCKKETAPPPPPLIQNGKIVLQVHHIGWIVTGCFTIIATAISFWLVNKHLQWYSNKLEQRHIVRILFMVPLYAIISFASFLWWNHATPLILIRDCYESTVLTAFFYLLLAYLSPDPEEQRRIFMKRGLSRQNDAESAKKGKPVGRWLFPLGFVAWKPENGLYFLQLMKWGVLQYCVLRPLTTLIAVILDYVGLYCESSWGLGWGYIYITIIVSVSVTISMYCLIQLYVTVSKDLARHKPLLKLLSIKAVVFLTFWQATFLSVLSTFGVVKDTQYMTADDINIGIGALLETFEMMLFALLHTRAFTYKVYRPPYDPNSDFPPPERTPRLKSLGHAMDFRETFRELWVGCVYMWHRFRGQEPSVDSGAIRAAHFEIAFGKQRFAQDPLADDDDPHTENIDLKKATLPRLQVEVSERIEVEIEGEKQWLGTGDNYGYGLKFLRKERSEGLEEQIEKELGKRGYTIRNDDEVDLQLPKHPKQKSWWRSIYNRISQTGRDDHYQIEEGRSVYVSRHRTLSRSGAVARSRSRRLSQDADVARRLVSFAELNTGDFDLDDQPPPSLIVGKNRHELIQSVHRWRTTVEPRNGKMDALMPLPLPAAEQIDHRRTINGPGRDARRHREFVPPEHGDLVSPNTPIIYSTSPGQHKQTAIPNSVGQSALILESSVNDSPAEISRVSKDARSEIPSTDGYRFRTQTVTIRFVPSQAPVVPANQLEMATQQGSAQHYLADVEVHGPMTADVADAGSSLLLEREGHNNVTWTPSIRSHRRESAIHRIQLPDLDDTFPPQLERTPRLQHMQRQVPVAELEESPVATTEARSPTAFRRSALQDSPSSPPYLKRQSHSPRAENPYPSSAPPATSRDTRSRRGYAQQGRDKDDGTNISTSARHGHYRRDPRPLLNSPPRGYDLSPTRSPVSPIEDNFSRYPANNLSPAYYGVSRHS